MVVSSGSTSSRSSTSTASVAETAGRRAAPAAQRRAGAAIAARATVRRAAPSSPGRTGLAKATVGTIVGDLEEARRGRRGTSRSAAATAGRPGQPVTLAGGRPVGVGLRGQRRLRRRGGPRPRRRRCGIGSTRHGRRRAARSSDALAASSPPSVAVDLDARRAAPARCDGGRPRSDRRRRPDRSSGRPNLGMTGTSVASTRSTTAFGWPGRRAAQQRRRLRRPGRAAPRRRPWTPTTCSTSPGPSASAPGWSSDGRLLRGARGFAGEVGHLPIGEPGAACGCGRTGCWEASVGLHAMLAAIGMHRRRTRRTRPRSRWRDAAGERGRPGRASRSRRSAACLGRGLAVLTGDPRSGGHRARRLLRRRSAT